MSGVFLGTPAAAVASLAAFADVEDVDLVITQPDRRGARGRSKISPPVKVAASQFGFMVAQPENGEFRTIGAAQYHVNYRRCGVRLYQ